MKQTAKEILKSQIWGIVKSGLLAFVFYLFSVTFINLIFYSDVPAGEKRDFTPVYICLIFIYALANYFGYVRKNCETYEENMKDTFSFKECLTDYIRDEGKYLFIIYGVLAIIFEICRHILPMPNIPGAALLFLFPLAEIVRIPILDMVVAYTVTMITVLAVSVYARYRVHKHWHPKKKHSL